MDVPTPPHAVVALAAFVRQRLADVTESIGGTLAPLWPRRDDDVLPAVRGRAAQSGKVVETSARQLAMVIVGAAAPFAPTPQARMRLLRQMHASGLLSRREADDAVEVLTTIEPEELRVIDAEFSFRDSIIRGA